jgi:8-oxo-dGTP pyrophosphatase MutT (NUDIX family)
MQITNFNLRVYGLLIEEGKVLVTHEHRAGMVMTKFPGGGLEKGEGLADGLKREFMEEMNLKVDVRGIFYVNDFLQISAFNPKDQLISFYFYVKPEVEDYLIAHGSIDKLNPNDQIFEWVSIDKLSEIEFTFPIDREVVKRILASRRT